MIQMYKLKMVVQVPLSYLVLRQLALLDFDESVVTYIEHTHHKHVNIHSWHTFGMPSVPLYPYLAKLRHCSTCTALYSNYNRCSARSRAIAPMGTWPRCAFVCMCRKSCWYEVSSKSLACIPHGKGNVRLKPCTPALLDHILKSARHKRALTCAVKRCASSAKSATNDQ